MQNNDFTINNFYIFIPVKLEQEKFKQQIKINDTELFLKNEFHVSILFFPNIIDKKISKKEIIDFFIDFQKEKPLSIKSYSNDFRFIKTIERGQNKESIINMVKIKNLNTFYQRLSKKFKIEISEPPTHVTLYTGKNQNGIGINSYNDLEKFTINFISKNTIYNTNNILNFY